MMTKRQLIDEILEINRGAEPGFLAQFDDGDLEAYLRHLRTAQEPRICQQAGTYSRSVRRASMRPASPDRPAVVLSEQGEQIVVAEPHEVAEPVMF